MTTPAFWNTRIAPRLFELVALPSRHAAAFVSKELADLPAGSRVLDVGIGTGIVSKPLSARGSRIDGVDPSASMLARASERLPDAVLRLGSADSIPFSTSTYDAVIANAVLKYVDTDSAEQVANELSRVAKPHSRILVGDLIFPLIRPRWLPEVAPSGVWADRTRFLEGLNRNGFRRKYTKLPFAAFLMVYER